MTAADQTVNDRPGPNAHCDAVVNGVTHGAGATFIGIHYMVTNAWEAVHCARCQQFLRWATDGESVINAAKRALGETPP